MQGDQTFKVSCIQSLQCSCETSIINIFHLPIPTQTNGKPAIVFSKAGIQTSSFYLVLP